MQWERIVRTLLWKRPLCCDKASGSLHVLKQTMRYLCDGLFSSIVTVHDGTQVTIVHYSV